MPAAPDDRTREAFAALTRAQQRLLADLLQQGASARMPAGELIKSVIAGALADSSGFEALQQAHYREQFELWMRHFGGGGAAATDSAQPTAATRDRRFAAREWADLPWFAWLRDAYLCSSRWLERFVDTAKVDEPTRRKLRFFTRQYLDAMAPSNWAASNPEALRLAFATRGASLARGLENLQADLAKGRISMTDESAFTVGRNLAVTPGAVVFQNDLVQVIQYAPTTPTVHAVPLVVVPPCINRFYVLDLQPHNSFVRHAVEQGLTVFMISWRNIGPALGRTSWDAYLQQGVIQAIDVARAVTGAPKTHALGFCVGGTMLASALAVLRRKRRRPAATLTLLATLLDFADPGEIGVFVDEPYVRQVEADFRDGGVFPGSRLASTFASLRANDLVWNYVVHNYLKGRTPEPFDLLHWNSDSANLAGTMYAYYVRNMYLENALREPDRLRMCGVPVDLARIGLPTYVLATREDHIVPWTSAYAGARLLGPNVEFVLGASGHIAGVVNPAAANRRSYRSGPPPGPSHEAWLEASREHAGSWWNHWTHWIVRQSGPRIAAPVRLGSAVHRPIEPAPGSYVREQC